MSPKCSNGGTTLRLTLRHKVLILEISFAAFLQIIVHHRIIVAVVLVVKVVLVIVARILCGRSKIKVSACFRPLSGYALTSIMNSSSDILEKRRQAVIQALRRRHTVSVVLLMLLKMNMLALLTRPVSRSPSSPNRPSRLLTTATLGVPSTGHVTRWVALKLESQSRENWSWCFFYFCSLGLHAASDCHQRPCQTLRVLGNMDSLTSSGGSASAGGQEVKVDDHYRAYLGARINVMLWWMLLLSGVLVAVATSSGNPLEFCKHSPVTSELN